MKSIFVFLFAIYGFVNAESVPIIQSIRVDDGVVAGEPFVVNITATDPVAIQSVRINFAGVLVDVPTRGTSTAIATARLRTEAAGLFTLTATAVNTAGVVSEPSSILVSVSDHFSDAPAEHVLDDLDRVSDPYALYEPGRLYESGLSTAAKNALAEEQRELDRRYDEKGKLIPINYWKKYLGRRARQPFDWKKYCGPTVTITPSGEVLECWLFLNPEISLRMTWDDVDLQTGEVDVLPYASWDPFMLSYFYQTFYDYYQWMESGLRSFPGAKLADPPVNQVPLQDDDRPVTLYSKQDARDLYIQTVAHALALEIGSFVPWSVLNYSQLDIDRLFSSQLLLNSGKYELNQIEYIGYWPYGDVITPAPPTTTFQFLVNQNIIRGTHFDTISRYLKWGRDHLLHGSSSHTTEDAERLWQYRGDGPVSRILEGTPHEADPNDIAHYTAGCHGASFFTSLLLRGINIPVATTWVPNFGDQNGHRSPVFLTIGRTMDHGDDIASAHVNIPSIDPSYIPPDWILITSDHFKAWFEPGNPLRWENVSRQLEEIAIEILPNRILDLHCDDLAANLTPANSSVYSKFSDWYTPSQLETQRQLWTRLNAKVTKLNYCAAYSLPVAPTLLFPANGATGVSKNPELNWNDVAGATSYAIQVATDPSFTNVVRSKNEPVSNWTVVPPLNDTTTYYWRVRAHNPCCGQGPYSSVFSFTTQ